VGADLGAARGHGGPLPPCLPGPPRAMAEDVHHPSHDHRAELTAPASGRPRRRWAAPLPSGRTRPSPPSTILSSGRTCRRPSSARWARSAHTQHPPTSPHRHAPAAPGSIPQDQRGGGDGMPRLPPGAHHRRRGPPRVGPPPRPTTRLRSRRPPPHPGLPDRPAPWRMPSTTIPSEWTCRTRSSASSRRGGPAAERGPPGRRTASPGHRRDVPNPHAQLPRT